MHEPIELVSDIRCHFQSRAQIGVGTPLQIRLLLGSQRRARAVSVTPVGRPATNDHALLEDLAATRRASAALLPPPLDGLRLGEQTLHAAVAATAAARATVAGTGVSRWAVASTARVACDQAREQP